MAEGEHTVGGTQSFEFLNERFVLFFGQFTRIILKDCLRAIDRGGVEKYDRRHIILERLCGAGNLLGRQHAH